MSNFVSSSPASTSFSISALEHKISNVEQEIKQVEIEIKTAEVELKNCTAEEKQDCRDRLQRLGEKEKQLREEKNLLLQQQIVSCRLETTIQINTTTQKFALLPFLCLFVQQQRDCRFFRCLVSPLLQLSIAHSQFPSFFSYFVSFFSSVC